MNHQSAKLNEQENPVQLVSTPLSDVGTMNMKDQFHGTIIKLFIPRYLLKNQFSCKRQRNCLTINVKRLHDGICQFLGWCIFLFYEQNI